MKATPDLGLLQTFAAVAEAQSFSKAARRLGVSKGTVSRGVQRLERTVGVELLHRDTHRVVLSTAGAALYERAAPALRALGEAARTLPEPDEEPTGELRIAAAADMGQLLLPDLVARFALRYPALRFDLRISNTRIDLLAERIDVAFRGSPHRILDSRFVVYRLGRSQMRLYASPTYLARRGEPKKLGDPGHDWVLFGHVARVADFPPRFAPRYACDDLFAVRELLRAGAGVGFLPGFLADPYVADGRLVESPPAIDLRTTGGLFMLTSARQPPRRVVLFREFVIDAMRRSPIG